MKELNWAVEKAAMFRGSWKILQWIPVDSKQKVQKMKRKQREDESDGAEDAELYRSIDGNCE